MGVFSKLRRGLTRTVTGGLINPFPEETAAIGAGTAAGALTGNPNIGYAVGSGAYAGLKSREAAAQQDKAARRAESFQEPYRQLGEEALPHLQNYLADPSSVRNLPGYQAGLDAGMGAINARAAASGRLGGGGHQEELARYAMDYQDQQHQRLLAPYFQAAGMGQSAAGAAGNIAMQRGQAQASGTNTFHNALRGGLQDYLGLEFHEQLRGGGKRKSGHKPFKGAVQMFRDYRR